MYFLTLQKNVNPKDKKEEINKKKNEYEMRDCTFAPKTNES